MKLGVAYSDMKFAPRFIKIRPLFRHYWHTHTRTWWPC